MTLAATVAETWLELLEQRETLRILHEQLRSNRETLQILELRFRRSLTSALDLDEQRQLVENTAATIPLTQADEEALRQQLALLLGKLPQSDVALSTAALPELPPVPATGVPADLLYQRPDVRSAFLALQAADERVVVARADRLPALRLTGSLDTSGNHVDELFDNWAMNLLASATAPLFDAGNRKAEMARTKAVVKERVAAYRETVLTAIQEVETALMRERRQRENLAGLDRQMVYARRALEEAQRRYEKGQNDYLRVLTARRSVQNLERELVQRQRALLTQRVTLHRALARTVDERACGPRRGRGTVRRKEDAMTVEHDHAPESPDALSPGLPPAFWGVLLGILVVLTAAAVAYWMVRSKPKARRGQTVRQATFVTVQEAARSNMRVLVPAMGEVVAAVEVKVQPEVSGEVVWVAANLQPGAVLKKGEALARIDATDYRLSVIQARSAVAQAEYDYKLELGYQDVAREEWAMHKEERRHHRAGRGTGLAQAPSGQGAGRA